MELEKNVKIYKPDDTREFYSTVLLLGDNHPSRIEIHPSRALKDPMQGAIASELKLILQGKHNRCWFSVSAKPKTITIGNLPILIQKQGSRYLLNGQALNLNEITNTLARVMYKSCFTDDQGVLMKTMISYMNMPENVRYVLENRLPYFFYENFRKIEVRLNVMQIEDDICAIEISDGVWGEISFKDLNTMCNFYIHGKQRGSWKFISPDDLYFRLIGEQIPESTEKVMLEFLKQNRQSDIVEKRAEELMKDLQKQYPQRIKIVKGEEGETIMYVRGKGFDWKLTDSKYKSDIQQVTTYVWQPNGVKSNSETSEIELSEPTWRGPICIDNMARGSSVGDQFAARALALLNDKLTIQVVNTIKRYINANENEYRIDWNEM
tara:strand:- start:1898 stop:3034 length:1137 start_codon:yes stop_codon:yes gene_type:complete